MRAARPNSFPPSLKNSRTLRFYAMELPTPRELGASLGLDKKQGWSEEDVDEKQFTFLVSQEPRISQAKDGIAHPTCLDQANRI